VKRSVTMAVLASVAILAPSISTGHAAVPSSGFWTALAPAMTPAGGWAPRGVALASGGTLRLAPSVPSALCAPADVDGGASVYDATAGLCAGHDPATPGAYHGHNYYNGGRFHYGALLSPVYAAVPFDHATASWVAVTPPSTWLQVHLRVRLETGVWTRWYALPIWASDLETVRRHSIDGQGGAATVETDTLALRSGRHATAYQLAVTLFTARTDASPALHRLSLAVSRASAGVPDPVAASPSAAWGRDLPAPGRSQMLARYSSSAYGGGGEVWCSPTATSMILAYWARRLGRPDLDVDVPRVAAGVYDWTYEGTGNWPFNVAYATSFAGMDGYVARFPSLAALEPWIAAGVPLALSVAFGPGELPGAPIPSTAGHLLVLRGFDHAGNPLVNDPAAPSDATVPRVYPRAAFARAWLAGSSGTAYVIFPRGWSVPPQEP